MRAEIGSMGLIRGLLDLTVLGGVGLRVLGVVANEGGVCARMLNPKPAPCGVNAGFKLQRTLMVVLGIQMSYSKLMML